MALLAAPLLARADDPAPRPAGGPRPLLRQLNEETQSLYQEVQAGVVRVQLPPPDGPAPARRADNPVRKWRDALDPAVRQHLEAQQKQTARGHYRKITASVDKNDLRATTGPSNRATTQPLATTQPGGWSMTPSADANTLILRPRAGGTGALQIDAGGGLTRDGQIVAGGGRVEVTVADDGSAFTPNNIGLLLDADGHVLVPICVERDAFEDGAARVMVGPGQMATAKFVGSDRQTNITVLKLDHPLGTPVKLTPARPREGALTMFLSPNSGVGRLMIWTNELKDWGVVVNMEGGVYGFARHGQFLSAAGCKPAVDQLVRTGTVKRPKLGLEVKWVQPDDPARERDLALGAQPAVRVNDVAASSPAADAGLAAGDLILRVNDQPVGDPSSFAAALSDPAPKASVKLLRDGRERTITIELPKDP